MPKKKGKRSKKKAIKHKSCALQVQKNASVEESKLDVSVIFNDIYKNLQSIFIFIFNDSPFISEAIKAAFKHYTRLSGLEAADSIYHPADCFMPIGSFPFLSPRHKLRCRVSYIRSAKRYGFNASDWAGVKYQGFLIVSNESVKDPALELSALDSVGFDVNGHDGLNALNRCLLSIYDLLKRYEILRTDFLLSRSIRKEAKTHDTSKRLVERLLEQKKKEAEVLEKKIIYLFSTINSAILRYVIIAHNGNVSGIQQRDYGLIAFESFDTFPFDVSAINLEELRHVFEASNLFIFYGQLLDVLDKLEEVKEEAVAEDRASAVESRNLFEQILREEKQAQDMFTSGLLLKTQMKEEGSALLQPSP